MTQAIVRREIEEGALFEEEDAKYEMYVAVHPRDKILLDYINAGKNHEKILARKLDEDRYGSPFKIFRVIFSEVPYGILISIKEKMNANGFGFSEQSGRIFYKLVEKSIRRENEMVLDFED
jgi:hypothetical protein